MSIWGHQAGASMDADTAAREADENGAQLIDLGEPRDWFAGHVHGARLVEPELLDMEFAMLDKNKRVIVLGRSPEGAAAASALLHQHGFDVCSVEGGVAAWKAAGHPMVKADGRPA
jgi:rhodanese-related sulfurtransferase